MSLDPQRLVLDWIAAYRGPVDVAHLLCDRHPGDGIAVEYLTTGAERTYTFDEIADLSRRCASVLSARGIGAGDRVATLLPKSPELMIAALAIWRLGAVQVPLFTAFGPDAIAYRLANSGARLVVTDDAQGGKLGTSVARLVVSERSSADTFGMAIRGAHPWSTNVSRSGDDLFIVLYTSGTTGHPKGARIPIKALASIESYMRFGLDVRDDDVFWNIADPGWAYGLYYALIGPMLLGRRTIFLNRPFSAAATWRLLHARGVTNFAAAPTTYRALQAAHRAGEIKGSVQLRAASSAGETLSAATNVWASETLGVAIHDQYGQTELGMFAMNHHHPALAQPLRDGSMGCATPGYRLTIIDGDGTELPPGTDGILAIDVPASPLYWFQGYFDDPIATAQRIVRGRYNATGDIARMDHDGFVFYAGRADDLITSAGYRIGPFEVETALLQHEAVADAAVVGKPDPLRGEVVCAFVVLRDGIAGSDELARGLSEFVKSRLSAHAFPREIRFVETLPRTPSGKLQRFLVRRQLATN